MTKLKKTFTAAIIMFLMVSCSSKPTPNNMSIGLSLTDRAADYALEGNDDMAAYTYNRALAKFRDMGKFCDMARVSLLMYIIDPSIENRDKLNDAASFASISSCKDETNIVNFLSGNNYDHSSLEEPYKSISNFSQNKDIYYLKNLTSSKNTSNRLKSSLFRIMAKTVLQNDPKSAIEYAERAKEIDGIHAWTKNILADEQIILKATQRLGYDAEIINKRIDILENAIMDRNQ